MAPGVDPTSTGTTQFDAITLLGPNGRLVDSTVGPLINFTAPNYLGLANHPAVIAAAHEALDTFGAGPGASPTVSGRSALHDQLEAELCARLDVEAAMITSSGSAANDAVLTTIAGAGDVIVSDELNHASIVDGCRLSRASTQVVEHGSPDAVAEAVSAARSLGARKVVIVTDGVFSVDGDVADVEALRQIAHEDEALVVVDDAHGFGVLGQGRGTASHLGVDANSIVTTISFSKAMGGFGGAITGRRSIIDEVRAGARSYMFSASLPPALTAAALAALELIFTGTLIDRLWANQRRFVERLDVPSIGTRWPTPIVPVIVGRHSRSVDMSRRLLDAGILAMPLGPPITAADAARIRFAITAAHTSGDLDTAADLVRSLFCELDASEAHADAR